MTDPGSRAMSLALDLLAGWLRERTGRAVTLTAGDTLQEPSALTATGTIDGRPLAAAVLFLAPPDGDSPWHQAKTALEQRIGARVTGGHIIWAPQGVELPEREPDSSDVVLRAAEAAGRFVPGGHGEIRFPVRLLLRRSDEEGSYVTARGGLGPHWATFTSRVFGHFQLDSTELHRLPAGDGNLSDLIDRIVDIANELPLGGLAEIPAEDAWMAQRLRSDTSGVAIIGEPPDSDRSSGPGLRRGLRQAITALREPLFMTAVEARVMLIVGPYTYLDQQPAGAALLGFDPALYRGIDLVALAAEANVKPLLDLTRNPLLAAAAKPAV